MDVLLSGNFDATGVVDKSVTIVPVFEIADTTTIEQLEELALAGVDYIKIADDIIFDRTIYFTGQTVLYSEKEVTFLRGTSFEGEMKYTAYNSRS